MCIISVLYTIIIQEFFEFGKAETFPNNLEQLIKRINFECFHQFLHINIENVSFNTSVLPTTEFAIFHGCTVSMGEYLAFFGQLLNLKLILPIIFHSFIPSIRVGHNFLV